jgi:hypothetical protein
LTLREYFFLLRTGVAALDLRSSRTAFIRALSTVEPYTFDRKRITLSAKAMDKIPACYCEPAGQVAYSVDKMMDRIVLESTTSRPVHAAKAVGGFSFD